jgi:hypothetical protein
MKGEAMSEERVKVIPKPSDSEFARVRAWDAEQARLAEQRDQVWRGRYCLRHGAVRSRVIYGPVIWGYGPGCKKCREQAVTERGWSRWYSNDVITEMQRWARFYGINPNSGDIPEPRRR